MGQLVRDTGPLIAMPRRVFVAFGGKEADDPAISERMVGLIRIVESNFRAAGYDDSNFRFVVVPDAFHTESAWAAPAARRAHVPVRRLEGTASSRELTAARRTGRSALRAELQLSEPVVDDQRVEDAEHVHADQQGRLRLERPCWRI